MFFLSKGSSKEIKNRKEFERKENISFFPFLKDYFSCFSTTNYWYFEGDFFCWFFFWGWGIFSVSLFYDFFGSFLEVFSIFLVIFCSKFLLIFFGLFCITIFYGFFLCFFRSLFRMDKCIAYKFSFFFCGQCIKESYFFSCKFWKLSSLQKLRRGFHLLWHDEFIANVGREKNLKN